MHKITLEILLLLIALFLLLNNVKYGIKQHFLKFYTDNTEIYFGNY